MAEVGRPWDRRSLKGRVPNIRYCHEFTFFCDLCALKKVFREHLTRGHAFGEISMKSFMLSERFRRKVSCFQRDFNEKFHAFREIQRKSSCFQRDFTEKFHAFREISMKSFML